MSTPIPMLDLMFFLTETVDNPRHVGSVLVFRKPKRGGGQTVRQIVDAYLAAKPLPPFNRIPVFRRPGLPVWEDAPRIDTAHHVLHLALPAPGSNEQLHRLVADLHAPMLERHRPGWKVYVIDGLADGRFALYHKCHHALVDGESGMRILRQSLSESATDRRIRTTIGLAHPQRPRPAPRGLQERLEREARQLAARSYSVGRGSLHALNQALGGLRGYSPRQPRAFTAPHTPMNDPIYNARSISHATLPLGRMQQVARAWGATVNDVTLCALDAGINRYLRRRGAAPDHPIVALCPVSLHDPGAKDVTTNVSAIFPALGPVSASIGQRLETIMANTRAAKAELKGLGKNVAYAYAVVAFAISETLTVASPEALGLVPANMLVSNVRGPEQPLYLNGARLEALFPVSTLIVGIGLNVTFMSYAGQVILGFTANGSALPEVESLARDTTDAFVGLERVTAQRVTRRPPARRTSRRRARSRA
jgi:diacylglycerol O-acyltransferase